MILRKNAKLRLSRLIQTTLEIMNDIKKYLAQKLNSCTIQCNQILFLDENMNEKMKINFV